MISKYTTIIRIIIAALAVSMLVAGPNMALLQQHQRYAASQTKQQEQDITDIKRKIRSIKKRQLLSTTLQAKESEK